MIDNDKFTKFDYIIVRIVLAILVVLGAIKVTWPAIHEVRQMLLK
jgi:hypothetical protein